MKGPYMRRAYLEVQLVCKMQLAKSPTARIVMNCIGRCNSDMLSKVLTCHMLQMQSPEKGCAPSGSLSNDFWQCGDSSLPDMTKLRHFYHLQAPRGNALNSILNLRDIHATGVVFEGGCTHSGPKWELGRCSILISPGSPASLPEARGDPRGRWGWGGAASGCAPP